MRSSTRTTLQCERLETRENPTGNVVVTVSGGGILAFGDGQDNHIRIEQNTAGDVYVIGELRTTVNGRPVIYLGRFAPNGVFVDLAAGKDHIEIAGVDSVANIEVHGAQGGDSIYLFSCTARGIVRVMGGMGNDTVFLAGVVAGNNIQLNGGADFNILHIENSVAVNGISVVNFDRRF